MKIPKGILKNAAKWGLVPAAAVGGYYARPVVDERQVFTMQNRDIAYTIDAIDDCLVKLGRPLNGWVDCENIVGWVVADIAAQQERNAAIRAERREAIENEQAPEPGED